MTEEAIKFKNVCKGASVGVVHSIMHFQNQSVIDELMQEFQTDSYEDLAFRLSIGE